MKSFKILAAFLVLIVTSSNAQIKNHKTENVKIYGNCDMCKTTIESAGTVKKLAQLNWNSESKIASITYDSLNITKEDILKQIALAGYDSDSFLAPKDTYNALPTCCQYDRAKPMKMENSSMDDSTPLMKHSTTNDSMVSKEIKSEDSQTDSTTFTNPLLSVYNEYFSLKDALIISDASAASKEAVNFLATINAVKMDELEMDVHMVWMKKINEIKSNVKVISESANIEAQRSSFISLSENMYNLMKISPLEAPIYYQHCPMANNGKGANWLSKENDVKNPYYGQAMLSCGKTMETIK